ncbi:MAG: magnesium chelatase ATPase subunit I [Chloroherpetonaceae bacterium]|nr:magnesium chelatase ATPase subunit I [Chloroherpetonaceae bacterium]MDW8438491.1 magnesium chelatase ATPase subunit I [Chloroherpetonaceae bacterium]
MKKTQTPKRKSSTSSRASKPDAQKKSPVFPFAAIVGQDELKLCLLLNVIDPRIGGVLAMGHRGTGKSTTVRALADVLPMIERAEGDRYNRSIAEIPKSEPHSRKTELIPVPVVDLPLGATEDRVCGTIDIEKALTQGVKAFEPGLLAQANRGFLYIDEVNLLDDHLVDVLLDVAASGVNVVEREGVSVRHPARFVLVGSGNPEEGELRPQLLDRFGLHARITTITSVAERVEIVKRRREFDANPEAFLEKWKPEQDALREKIVQAQSLAPKVAMPDEVLMKIATLCMRLGIDGHRGELTITRAASAHAAFEGRTEVSFGDVRAIAVPALRHRLRRDPLETIDAGEKVERELNAILKDEALV